MTTSISEPSPRTGSTILPAGGKDNTDEDAVGGAHCCTAKQLSSSSSSSPSSSPSQTLTPPPPPPPPAITVILFCGLPASGKSTLAKWLERHLLLSSSSSSSSSSYDVHLIEYDQIEEEQLQQQLSLLTTTETATAKPSLVRYDGAPTKESDNQRLLATDTDVENISSAQQQDDAADNHDDTYYLLDNEDGNKNNIKANGRADGDGRSDVPESSSSSSISNNSDVRRNAWKRAREIAVRRLEQIINRCYHTYYCEEITDTTEDNNNNDDGDDRIGGHDSILSQQQRRQRRTIILMDDNFHLRGMRKQIHRLLHRYKEKEISLKMMAIRDPKSQTEAPGSSIFRHIDFNFGIIWIDSSVECCIERNCRRSLSASTERQQQQHRKFPTNQVITKMKDVFEPPRAVWESNHIIVKAEEMIVTDTTKKMDDIGKTFNEECLARILSFVVECPKIIDIPNDDEVNEESIQNKESARETTRQNQVHNLDQTLRTWVGTVAKFDKALARAANDGRKAILQESRSCSTSITTDTQPQEQDYLMPKKNFIDVDDIKKRFIDLVIPIDSQLSSIRRNIFEILE